MNLPHHFIYLRFDCIPLRPTNDIEHLAAATTLIPNPRDLDPPGMADKDSSTLTGLVNSAIGGAQSVLGSITGNTDHKVGLFRPPLRLNSLMLLRSKAKSTNRRPLRTKKSLTQSARSATPASHPPVASPSTTLVAPRANTIRPPAARKKLSEASSVPNHSSDKAPTKMPKVRVRKPKGSWRILARELPIESRAHLVASEPR